VTQRACILGASGYTGRELERLLRAHPSLVLDGFFSAREGETPEAPELECDRALEPLDWERVARCDGVFLCTPHGTSALLARRCLELRRKVVDLSADFRLRDAHEYERAYGHAHPAPELLARAVYGLTEHARDAVAGTELVANPGCYPTAILLALKPLLAAGLVDLAAPIVADAKSGTSGAGKQPSARTQFGSVHENFLAYAVGTHRHAPEIRQEAGTGRLVFTPHLLPVFRGILATIYVVPRAGADAAELRECLRSAYAGERFVRVFRRGQPELDRVQRTNECHVAVADGGPCVVLTSAIDNLVKGAAGQALQNMNLLLGLEEGAGLA
jgi:N-acetyl-gamma-glutamyl-phosphate reductase